MFGKFEHNFENVKWLKCKVINKTLLKFYYFSHVRKFEHNFENVLKGLNVKLLIKL